MDKQTQQHTAEWSSPTLGVQHLRASNTRRWATVQDRGSFAELLCWYPDCGFTPDESMHANAASARAAGEHYVATGVAL